MQSKLASTEGAGNGIPALSPQWLLNKSPAAPERSAAVGVAGSGQAPSPLGFAAKQASVPKDRWKDSQEARWRDTNARRDRWREDEREREAAVEPVGPGSVPLARRWKDFKEIDRKREMDRARDADPGAERDKELHATPTPQARAEPVQDRLWNGVLTPREPDSKQADKWARERWYGEGVRDAKSSTPVRGWHDRWVDPERDVRAVDKPVVRDTPERVEQAADKDRQRLRDVKGVEARVPPKDWNRERDEPARGWRQGPLPPPGMGFGRGRPELERHVPSASGRGRPSEPGPVGFTLGRGRSMMSPRPPPITPSRGLTSGTDGIRRYSKFEIVQVYRSLAKVLAMTPLPDGFMGDHVPRRDSVSDDRSQLLDYEEVEAMAEHARVSMAAIAANHGPAGSSQGAPDSSFSTQKQEALHPTAPAASLAELLPDDILFEVDAVAPNTQAVEEASAVLKAVGEQQPAACSEGPSPAVVAALQEPVTQSAPRIDEQSHQQQTDVPEYEAGWLYKDPQGDIQGPFSTADIIEWFEAGFFSVDLPVKREGSSPQEPFLPLVVAVPSIRPKHMRLPPGYDSMPDRAPSAPTLSAVETPVPAGLPAAQAGTQFPTHTAPDALLEELYGLHRAHSMGTHGAQHVQPHVVGSPPMTFAGDLERARYSVGHPHGHSVPSVHLRPSNGHNDHEHNAHLRRESELQQQLQQRQHHEMLLLQQRQHQLLQQQQLLQLQVERQRQLELQHGGYGAYSSTQAAGPDTGSNAPHPGYLQSHMHPQLMRQPVFGGQGVEEAVTSQSTSGQLQNSWQNHLLPQAANMRTLEQIEAEQMRLLRTNVMDTLLRSDSSTQPLATNGLAMEQRLEQARDQQMWERAQLAQLMSQQRPLPTPSSVPPVPHISVQPPSQRQESSVIADHAHQGVPDQHRQQSPPQQLSALHQVPHQQQRLQQPQHPAEQLLSLQQFTSQGDPRATQFLDTAERMKVMQQPDVAIAAARSKAARGSELSQVADRATGARARDVASYVEQPSDAAAVEVPQQARPSSISDFTPARSEFHEPSRQRTSRMARDSLQEFQQVQDVQAALQVTWGTSASGSGDYLSLAEIQRQQLQEAHLRQAKSLYQSVNDAKATSAGWSERPDAPQSSLQQVQQEQAEQASILKSEMPVATKPAVEMNTPAWRTSSTKPKSLKEIQEEEAREQAARLARLAEEQALMAAALGPAAGDGSGSVWRSGPGVVKSLRQIQMEEEVRAGLQAQSTSLASTGSSAWPSRPSPVPTETESGSRKSDVESVTEVVAESNANNEQDVKESKSARKKAKAKAKAAAASAAESTPPAKKAAETPRVESTVSKVSLAEFINPKTEVAISSSGPAWGSKPAGRTPSGMSLQEIQGMEMRELEQRLRVQAEAASKEVLVSAPRQAGNQTWGAQLPRPQGPSPFATMPAPPPPPPPQPQQQKPNGAVAEQDDDMLFWDYAEDVTLQLGNVASSKPRQQPVQEYPSLAPARSSSVSSGWGSTPFRRAVAPGAALQQTATSSNDFPSLAGTAPRSAATAGIQRATKATAPKPALPAMRALDYSLDFRNWCQREMKRLANNDDMTLLEFCMSLKAAEEIGEYLSAYLGQAPTVKAFTTEFVKRKDAEARAHARVMNQTARQSQDRPTSIATAAEDNAVEASDAASANASKVSKSKMKGKAKRLDPSLLGFSVASNRFLKGEIQTPDDL